MPIQARDLWFHAPIFSLVSAAVQSGKWPSEYDPSLTREDDRALVMAYYSARSRMAMWEDQESRRKAKNRERLNRLARGRRR